MLGVLTQLQVEVLPHEVRFELAGEEIPWQWVQGGMLPASARRPAARLRSVPGPTCAGAASERAWGVERAAK